jgi:glycerophosphoryl diester phosphodiesterase
VDVLEMDVQLTRDGHLIVMHDEDGARTTGARVVWGDIDLADALKLDAGWGFVAADGSRPFAGKDIRIPTFDDVLVAFPRVRLNVDIKGERAVDVMLDVLRAHNAADRVTLASFHLATMRDVRRRGYSGETTLSRPEVASLLALPAVLWRQLPLTGTAAQVPVSGAGLHFDRAAFIAKCHSIGLRVDFWVIDDATEAARLLDLGADGIMTNAPSVIRALFQ